MVYFPRNGFHVLVCSCLHTAYILQEAIHHTREKAYVTFLDTKKAFNTVWYEGLFVKLYNKGFPVRIWYLLWNWYNTSSCSVTWNHAISTSFPIHQGVRQGAILSPLLYSIFMDELLDLLTTSGLGVTINTIYCGAPMYAHDLALVADSPEELQATFFKWKLALHSQFTSGLPNLNASPTAVFQFSQYIFLAVWTPFRQIIIFLLTSNTCDNTSFTIYSDWK